jgi:7,8-dihydroneopterin aldolase/epimerase/oxygenase
MKITDYKIHFKDLAYFAKIGYYFEEQKLGQRIYIDLVITVNPKNVNTKDIHSIYDYSVVSEICNQVIDKTVFQFLEELASKLAQEILMDKRINLVKIIIKKPSVPLNNILKHVAVDMEFSN